MLIYWSQSWIKRKRFTQVVTQIQASFQSPYGLLLFNLGTKSRVQLKGARHYSGFLDIFGKSWKDSTIKKFDFKEFIRTKTMRQRAKLRKRIQTILINKERFSKELHCLDYSETEVHSWVQIKLTKFKLQYHLYFKWALKAIYMCYKIVKLLGTDICSDFLTVLKYQVGWEGFDSGIDAFNFVNHILRI